MSDGLASNQASAGYPREREAARSAILAAARRLYDRDGIAAVSLSAVAKEAQLATAAVYAQFSGRRDLLARLLPQADLSEELRLPEAAKPAKTAAKAPANSYDGLLRAQAQALDQITKRGIVPGRRDGTDAALSRLETRLGAAEKGLTALEQRLDGGLKTLDSETGKLTASLKEIRRRVERFEERQQAALAALRRDLLTPQPSLSSPPAEAGYLRTARQAAIEAAQAAEKPKRSRFSRRSLKRWAAIGLAAFLVLWFDIYVFAHYAPAKAGEGQPQPASFSWKAI